MIALLLYRKPINVLQRGLRPFFGEPPSALSSVSDSGNDRFAKLKSLLDWTAELSQFEHLERFKSQKIVSGLLENKFRDLAKFSDTVSFNPTNYYVL